MARQVALARVTCLKILVLLDFASLALGMEEDRPHLLHGPTWLPGAPEFLPTSESLLKMRQDACDREQGHEIYFCLLPLTHGMTQGESPLISQPPAPVLEEQKTHQCPHLPTPGKVGCLSTARPRLPAALSARPLTVSSAFPALPPPPTSPLDFSFPPFPNSAAAQPPRHHPGEGSVGCPELPEQARGCSLLAAPSAE